MRKNLYENYSEVENWFEDSVDKYGTLFWVYEENGQEYYDNFINIEELLDNVVNGEEFEIEDSELFIWNEYGLFYEFSNLKNIKPYKLGQRFELVVEVLYCIEWVEGGYKCKVKTNCVEDSWEEFTDDYYKKGDTFIVMDKVLDYEMDYDNKLMLITNDRLLYVLVDCLDK